MSQLLIDKRLRTLFQSLITATCGFTFGGDREKTLITALGIRMGLRNISLPELYYAVLNREEEELLALIELLTVNETYFFREMNHLQLMIDTLVPELLASRRHGTIRILSAGCSTGEEPYSIAMLLRERYGAESERLFNITGVDIDSKAIACARKGIYGKSSHRGTNPKLLERYFEPVGEGTYQICQEIRRQVGFDVINLLGNSYSTGMQLPDIIFYRNVSIYFPRDVQRQVFTRLAELLNEGGALLVGAAETLHHDVGILALVERNSLFFYRKGPVVSSVVEQRGARRFATPLVKGGWPLPAVASCPPVTASLQSKSAAVGIDPQDRFALALEKVRMNQHDQALDLLEAALGDARSLVKAHGLKASLLLHIARYDDARRVCETILSLDPLCREAYLMLGYIARHQGDDGEACKRFREALYLDSTCWFAHFYSAEIMFSRQESKRARNSYEKVVKILESDSCHEPEEVVFPLSFNAQQYISICRHKLSLLKEN